MSDQQLDFISGDFQPPQRHTIERGGYAAPPGSGPVGETCQTCDHYCTIHGGRYRKCLKIEKNWTHGKGTDIKARSLAYRFWEPESALRKEGVAE